MPINQNFDLKSILKYLDKKEFDESDKSKIAQLIFNPVAIEEEKSQDAQSQKKKERSSNLLIQILEKNIYQEAGVEQNEQEISDKNKQIQYALEIVNFYKDIEFTDETKKSQSTPLVDLLVNQDENGKSALQLIIEKNDELADVFAAIENIEISNPFNTQSSSSDIEEEVEEEEVEEEVVEEVGVGEVGVGEGEEGVIGKLDSSQENKTTIGSLVEELQKQELGNNVASNIKTKTQELSAKLKNENTNLAEAKLTAQVIEAVAVKNNVDRSNLIDSDNKSLQQNLHELLIFSAQEQVVSGQGAAVSSKTFYILTPDKNSGLSDEKIEQKSFATTDANLIEGNKLKQNERPNFKTIFENKLAETLTGDLARKYQFDDGPKLTEDKNGNKKLNENGQKLADFALVLADKYGGFSMRFTKLQTNYSLAIPQDLKQKIEAETRKKQILIKELSEKLTSFGLDSQENNNTAEKLFNIIRNASGTAQKENKSKQFFSPKINQENPDQTVGVRLKRILTIINATELGEVKEQDPQPQIEMSRRNMAGDGTSEAILPLNDESQEGGDDSILLISPIERSMDSTNAIQRLEDRSDSQFLEETGEEGGNILDESSRSIKALGINSKIFSRGESEAEKRGEGSIASEESEQREEVSEEAIGERDNNFSRKSSISSVSSCDSKYSDDGEKLLKLFGDDGVFNRELQTREEEQEVGQYQENLPRPMETDGAGAIKDLPQPSESVTRFESSQESPNQPASGLRHLLLTQISAGSPKIDFSRRGSNQVDRAQYSGRRTAQSVPEPSDSDQTAEPDLKSSADAPAARGPKNEGADGSTFTPPTGGKGAPGHSKSTSKFHLKKNPIKGFLNFTGLRTPSKQKNEAPGETVYSRRKSSQKESSVDKPSSVGETQTHPSASPSSPHPSRSSDLQGKEGGAGRS